MPILDALVVIGAIAISATGALAIRMVWRRRSPEARGRENAREDAADGRRRCHFCRKPTDPDVDLYIEPHWYHRTCNRNEGKSQ